MTMTITMFGVSKSGKTLLTTRIASVPGDEFSDTYVETIGIDFRLTYRTVTEYDREEKLKIQVWDTGGAQRFAGISRSYTRSQVSHFVIDPTAAIEPQIAFLNYFLEQPTSLKAGSFCNIVISKCDLLESIEAVERKARLEKIEAYRQELITNHQFKSELVKTSATTNEGIDELMQLSIKQFLELRKLGVSKSDNQHPLSNSSSTFSSTASSTTHLTPIQPQPEITIEEYATKFSNLDSSKNVSLRKQQAQALFEQELAFAGDNLQKIQNLLTAAKPYLNEHKKPVKDKRYGIHNTKTWQHCVKLARKRGLGILTDIAGIGDRSERENTLNFWKAQSLFASHRGNSFFTGAFGRTKAQKEIEHLQEKIRLKV